MDREESGISHKIEDGILYVTVDGSVTVSDTIAYVQNHIEVWAQNSRVLWDCRRTLFPRVVSETLSGLSDEFGEVFRVRAGWRAAILVREVDDIVGNMFVDMLQDYSVPVEYKAFVNLHEARKWLQTSV